jgi:hypothetical protein
MNTIIPDKIIEEHVFKLFECDIKRMALLNAIKAHNKNKVPYPTEMYTDLRELAASLIEDPRIKVLLEIAQSEIKPLTTTGFKSFCREFEIRGSMLSTKRKNDPPQLGALSKRARHDST